MLWHFSAEIRRGENRLWPATAEPANFVWLGCGSRTCEFCLAGVAGFEPTNAGIKIPCLTAWRHPIALKKYGAGDKFRTCYLQSHNLALYRLSYARHILGAPGETRTPDTRLRRPLLYPAELRAHKHICCAQKLRHFGAGDGNRTHATSLEG